MTVFVPSRTDNPALLTLAYQKLSKASKAFWQTFIRLILTLAGVSSLITSAFLLNTIVGFAALGVGLLVVEWAVKR